MVFHTSILNADLSCPLSEKIDENYSIPKHDVLHSDRLKVIKEKQQKSKTTNDIFVLTEKYLFCSADDLTTEGNNIVFTAKVRISLQWIMCNFETKDSEKGKKHFIEFIKNNKKIVCDALSEDRFNKWREVLRARVVHMNFHNKYRIDGLSPPKNKSYLVKMVENESGEIFLVEKINKEMLKGDTAVVSMVERIETLKNLTEFSGVLRFKEVHETGHSLYIIYDPYFGGPVFSHNSKYTTADFLIILKSVLSILKALEVKGISHNYIRPKSIYFKYSGKSIAQNEIILTNLSKVKRVKQQYEDSFGQMSPVDLLKEGLSDNKAYNQDVVDLGRTCLNLFYYAQYNKLIDNGADYVSIINSPSFFMSSSRNLTS